ncbi:MAG: hypothetical protein ACK4F6_19130, partial [Hylemonella sp.]
EDHYGRPPAGGMGDGTYEEQYVHFIAQPRLLLFFFFFFSFHALTVAQSVADAQNGLVQLGVGEVANTTAGDQAGEAGEAGQRAFSQAVATSPAPGAFIIQQPE